MSTDIAKRKKTLAVIFPFLLRIFSCICQGFRKQLLAGKIVPPTSHFLLKKELVRGARLSGFLEKVFLPF